MAVVLIRLIQNPPVPRISHWQANDALFDK